MSRRLRLLLTLTLALAASPAAAQDDQTLIQEQWAQVLAREQPLAEMDIRIYLENAEAIYRLRFEPEKAEETAAAIKAWTTSRFTYVTTKMAVGLHQLLRPGEDLKLPEFAKPSAPEQTLIRQNREALVRTLESLQAKYLSSGSP